jgi:DNA modification methylase
VIHHGDLFDILPTLPADSVDACITDPPYELAFMSKKWDASGVAFRVETWQQVYRVLKPGAHLLAFGGTRTSHRMVCAIEDAGFEIRDSLCWLYGSGFPKSLNVSKAIDEAAGAERETLGTRIRLGDTKSYGGDTRGWKTDHSLSRTVTAPATDAAKQWDGWGTALKPAFEPIVLARKPLRGTVVANVLAHGTGALNIDACRIGTNAGWSYPNGPGGSEPHHMQRGERKGDASAAMEASKGRWPSNVLLDESAAAMLDAQSGETTSPQSVTLGGQRQQAFGMSRMDDVPCFGDTGGASRFFYVAKPSREERDYGCWDLRLMSGAERTGRKEGSAGLVGNPENKGQTGNPYSGGNGSPLRNSHPTVKPVELIRYLVKLITPPNGTCLDPFMGSGTTGMACRYELRQFIGIEREADYIAIAERRIAACAPLFGDEGEQSA